MARQPTSPQRSNSEERNTRSVQTATASPDDGRRPYGTASPEDNGTAEEEDAGGSILRRVSRTMRTLFKKEQCKVPGLDEAKSEGPVQANALETVTSLSTQSDGTAAGSSVDGAGAGGSTPAPIRMAAATPATENVRPLGIPWKTVIIAVLFALVVTVPAIMLVGRVVKVRDELNRNVEALETLKQEISQLKGLRMNQSCQAPAPSMPSTATGGNGVGGGRTSGDFAAINMNEPLMVPLELVNWLVSTGPLIERTWQSVERDCVALESEDKMVDAPTDDTP